MSAIAAGPYYSSRWGRLIPIAFITYSLAYVDRANYSLGAAGGMAHDLNIDAAASSLLGALFFLGYFFFQVPAAYYAAKRSAKELIFWSLILWGIFAAATGLLTDIRLLYVDRFLLGVAESVVLPGMLIFLGHWFVKAERSRANTFLILGNPITVCGCRSSPAIWSRHAAGAVCSSSKARRRLSEPLSGAPWSRIGRAKRLGSIPMSALNSNVGSKMNSASLSR
jgi:MFS family permease